MMRLNCRLKTIFSIFWLLTAFAGGVLAAADPCLVIDAKARQIACADKPGRIVSVSLATDEVSLELLRRVGLTDALKGVSSTAFQPLFSNIVDELKLFKAIKSVGAEAETVAVLLPDLVLSSEYNRPEFLRALEKLKIRAYISGPFNGFSDIRKLILDVGKLTGTEVASRKLVEEFDAELGALKSVQKKQAKEPTMMSFSAEGVLQGRKTIFDDIVHAAGAINLASKMGFEGWPRLDAERLAKFTPDYILVEGDPESKADILKKLQTLPPWKNMDAVKKGQLIIVPSAELATVSHHVLKAVRRIHREILERSNSRE